jgi:peptide methionine sulfoxide reductase MsrB
VAKETRAQVVCADCGGHLGHKDVVVPEGMPAVSHGLCDDCKAEAMKALRKFQKERR